MEPEKTDTDLPVKFANLDLMETGDSIAKKNVTELNSRVLRKRKQSSPEANKTMNRRVSMRPRKNNILTENTNPKQIEALYLNKKIKNVSQTLETIYEEPKSSSSNSKNTGRKVKRLLTFQSQYSKEKIKKRRAKIKKLLGNKTFLNRKKISMKVFLKNIECLELDEVTHSENQVLENGAV
ncbi:uncharacterized protein LOC126969189 [Leptidea sinapis]|uniref:uncharacterized protein LOC126969189 n=1 Tax=Leptidea sinapis TaxID=189913 RepID=UPI002128442D|nr:uncharacterized protein LOC126969189 [Leptidea sinapis]